MSAHDIETATRPQDANGHAPAEANPDPDRGQGRDLPTGCPVGSLSCITGEYSVHLGYAELTDLMDEVFDLWDRVEAAGTTTVIGDGFDDLIAHVERLRSWTGWGGVAGKYLRLPLYVHETRLSVYDGHTYRQTEETMKMTVYLPDDLGAEVKDQLGDANISAICQAALRAELTRRAAVAQIDAEAERIELWDGDRGRKVAFRGRRVAGSSDLDVYVTPKGGVVVSVPAAVSGGLDIYEDFEEYTASLDMERDGSSALAAEVADALGEEYTEELDI
jgi:post-segregation antitoxin (ccd killing protein)